MWSGLWHRITRTFSSRVGGIRDPFWVLELQQRGTKLLCTKYIHRLDEIHQ